MTNTQRTWLFVGIGAAVIIIIILFAVFTGDDEEAAVTTIAPTTTAAETTTTAAEETTTTAAEETTTTAVAAATAWCEVTDVGGVDDKSFNELAFKGAQDAAAKHGGEARVLESQAETDYAVNIDSFVAQGDCDLIVTVGFLLGDATSAAATANPGQPFAIVDFAYDPTIDNVVGLVFTTDQAAFLAGYLAAGMSETGVVGTYGGINIGGPVTDFMDGFVLGVRHYNEAKGTDVTALGWDPDTGEGLFTGNFESLDDGRAFAENLADEGADVILAVAGPVGLGSAAVAQERGLMMVGVDADQFLTAPEFSDVWLSSVQKKIDVAVLLAADNVVDGTFAGGVVVGTLANGGVGLAPFHNFEGDVPAELVAELAEIEAEIIAGDIVTKPTR